MLRSLLANSFVLEEVLVAVLAAAVDEAAVLDGAALPAHPAKLAAHISPAKKTLSLFFIVILLIFSLLLHAALRCFCDSNYTEFRPK